MKNSNIDRAIDHNPKALHDVWAFPGDSIISGDGGVIVDFYCGYGSRYGNYICMIVQGGEDPQSIADAAWSFFHYYKGKEKELLEGRVDWMPWFGARLEASTIAGLLTNEIDESLLIESQLSEELVETYNQLVETRMKGHPIDIEALRSTAPAEYFDRLVSEEAIRLGVRWKVTCPIVEIQKGEAS